MIMAPQCIGNQRLSKETLRQDIKTCRRIGPCGIGERAVYLNSFFLDRRYYVVWADVRRLFKRVAMSKGGFSGKGVFGSMAYLVAQLSDGREIQCNFKYEQQVDQLLAEAALLHPEIPVHSLAAEKKLEEERVREQAQYVKQLSPTAQQTICELQDAMDYLEQRPELSSGLSAAAKEKRTWEQIGSGYKVFAVLIGLASMAAVVFGLWAMTQQKGFALYFVLFGFAFMLLVMTTRVMPTASHNSKSIQRDYEQALADMNAYLASYAQNGEGFPLPVHYAHPVVLRRMIRLVRKGRAQTIDEALAAEKEELLLLSADVKVSQREYDEVAAVKPMFRAVNFE